MKYLCVIPVHNETPEVFAEAFFSMYFQCKKLDITVVVVLDNVDDIKVIEFAYFLESGGFCDVQPLAFGNLSSVLNIYLKLGDFDYMIRMDGDDISHPDRLEKQIAYLEKHNHTIDVLGTNMQAFNHGDFTRKSLYITDKKEIAEPDYKLDSPWWMVNHGSTILKRESVLKIGGYDETLGLHDGQDTDLWKRMFNAGYNIRNVTEVLYYYRVKK